MSATAAFAADDKPAIVFDIGGKFDKSFNESMYNGSEKFKAETGIAYGEFEIANEAQREQAIRQLRRPGLFADHRGGLRQAAAVEKVAKEYPDLKFAIVDMVVDLPNVQSLVFKEHEGSYLVGMLAGMASKSGKVGFVGGHGHSADPQVRCGYAQGVKAAKADATIFQNMTGDTGAAWNDRSRAARSPRARWPRARTWSMRPPAPPASACCRRSRWRRLSIGVDANQNYLHPGKVLTSMLKRVDVAVYNVMKSARTAPSPRHQGPGPRRGRCRLRHGRQQQGSLSPPRMQAKVESRQGRHHRRQAGGARLTPPTIPAGAVTRTTPSPRVSREGDPGVRGG